jgi:cytoskeleton protein RodZ
VPSSTELRIQMADETSDFGARLREARERSGISLHQIAATTKLSVRALEALERNQPSRLAGGIFLRATIRAYAREVGLEPEETVRLFLARFPEESQSVPTADSLASSVQSRGSNRVGIIGAALALLAVLAGIVALAVLYVDRPEAVQPRPETPAVAENALSGPEGSQEAFAAVSEEEVVGDDGVRLLLNPQAPCWVSAVIDGERRVSRLLQAGERFELEAQRHVELRIGDAGALAMSVNGMPARRLGKSGEPVTLTISADNVKAFLVGG